MYCKFVLHIQHYCILSQNIAQTLKPAIVMPFIYSCRCSHNSRPAGNTLIFCFVRFVEAFASSNFWSFLCSPCFITSTATSATDRPCARAWSSRYVTCFFKTLILVLSCGPTLQFILISGSTGTGCQFQSHLMRYRTAIKTLCVLARSLMSK